MRIVIVQTDIAWSDPASNRQRLERTFDKHPEGELFVLPEMFTTGFCMQPDQTAEPEGGETLAWMKRQANERNCAIAGSVAVTENGKYYNRFYFVHPDGFVCKYDKRHLFAYAGENQHYSSGYQRVIANYRGVRMLLQVCYDLRFPVWSRNQNGEEGYDVMLYVANWPTSRMAVWNTLLQARAIENQCYVVGVNRVGNDPACEYAGGSAVVNPYGHVQTRCEDRKEESLETEIDMEALLRFRQKFPVLRDADSFIIR